MRMSRTAQEMLTRWPAQSYIAIYAKRKATSRPTVHSEKVRVRAKEPKDNLKVRVKEKQEAKAMVRAKAP